MKRHIQLAYEQPREGSDATGGALPAPPTLRLDEVARLAAAADNAYIATRDLQRGSVLLGPEPTTHGAGAAGGQRSGLKLTLSVGVLEGHRFARTRIDKGEHACAPRSPSLPRSR